MLRHKLDFSEILKKSGNIVFDFVGNFDGNSRNLLAFRAGITLNIMSSMVCHAGVTVVAFATLTLLFGVATFLLRYCSFFKATQYKGE